ncbi:MAG: 50S ribosomal protein L21 [Anaerolineae bacterium]|jgi:large subunit ribosomal protein L21|nr:50S ribosomal protein L21 [Chloroflexota bacterium]
MYAIIETGGKQYRVRVGQTVDVERLDAQAGDTVELDRVLMIGGEEGQQIGSPVLESARVRATVVDQVRGPKVINFKYRAKTRIRVRKGHRQDLTRLRIEAITA